LKRRSIPTRLHGATSQKIINHLQTEFPFKRQIRKKQFHFISCNAVIQSTMHRFRRMISKHKGTVAAAYAHAHRSADIQTRILHNKHALHTRIETASCGKVLETLVLENLCVLQKPNACYHVHKIPAQHINLSYSNPCWCCG
jgi:hypothetical protein